MRSSHDLDFERSKVMRCALYFNPECRPNDRLGVKSLTVAPGAQFLARWAVRDPVVRNGQRSIIKICTEKEIFFLFCADFDIFWLQCYEKDLHASNHDGMAALLPILPSRCLGWRARCGSRAHLLHRRARCCGGSNEGGRHSRRGGVSVQIHNHITRAHHSGAATL